MGINIIMVNNFLQFINLCEQETKLREDTRTNKFNIHWQIVRADAKDIKNPDEKLSFVLSFLNKHKSKENFDRVRNWVKMTGVSYKGEVRQKFEDAVAKLDNKKDDFEGEDLPNDLSKIDTKSLNKVYNDLKKRKYGFQFKSVPKAHTEFMSDLEDEIKKRN